MKTSSKYDEVFYDSYEVFMANIDQYRYSVGNFSYASKERAEEAVKEQQRIEKLESQMDYNKPQLVYTLYRKVLEGGVFTTPQGILYLVHLQDYLVSVRKQLGGDIPMIPEDLIRTAQTTIADSSGNNSANNMIEKANHENSASESEQNSGDGSEETSSANGKKGGKGSTAGMRAVLKQKKKLEENLLVSRIVILFLVVLVVAMLIIAGVSDSPTILNYKKQIQNEYVEWQQQLEEKEAELREREALLNESNPYSSGNSNSNDTKMNDEEN